jgi:hypothetical protein
LYCITKPPFERLRNRHQSENLNVIPTVAQVLGFFIEAMRPVFAVPACGVGTAVAFQMISGVGR